MLDMKWTVKVVMTVKNMASDTIQTFFRKTQFWIVVHDFKGLTVLQDNSAVLAKILWQQDQHDIHTDHIPHLQGT